MLSARSFDERFAVCHGEHVLTTMSNLDCWDADATAHVVVVVDQCIPCVVVTRVKHVGVS